VESRAQLSNSIKTGDQVTVDLAHNTLLHEASGVTHELAPLGDAYEVIREGGIFAFARARGMIGART
jgi:3-isopropylmalate/(R)-2-methylmalate dehydratase small subunit